MEARTFLLGLIDGELTTVADVAETAVFLASFRQTP